MNNKTTFNVSFYCRESKKTKKGVAPIEATIIVNGKRIMMTLPRKENPKAFNKQMKAKSNNEIKEYIADAFDKIQSKVLAMQKKNIPITANNIKDFIRNGFNDNYTLEKMFNDYISIIREKYNKGKASYNQLIQYEHVEKLFYQQVASKETNAENIKPDDIFRFKNWLETNFKNATTKARINMVKSVFRNAFVAGKITSNPTANVFVKRQPEEIIFLNDKELKKLEDFDFTEIGKPYLDFIKDIFIFQTHTCLSYIDLKNLSVDEIQENQFGKFIKKRRIKTNNEFLILLDTTALYILDKYNYKLKIPNYQVYHNYLHQIEDILKLSIKLTSHVARRTGATILLNNGTPKEIVQHVLGHSNIKQVETYAKMLDETTLLNLSQLEERRTQQQLIAQKMKSEQMERLRLKIALQRQLELLKTAKPITDAELENIIDEVYKEEPFDGTLERDLMEDNYSK